MSNLGLEDDFDEEPEVDVQSGSFGDFEMVGHGEVINSSCGSFSVYGCLRTELHDRVTLEGVNYRGKVYLRKVFHSCDKPSCPVCFKRGWAVREAENIEARLSENGKYGKGFGKWGLIEHLIVGVPVRYFGLDYEKLRLRVLKALYDRNVIGGSLIFHGGRYADYEESRRKHVPQGWYWSPHFHVLGFIRDGYGKCRHCPRCVKGCGGFVDRNYRVNEVDGFYVKVKGKRKTVGGTAWYQLNHSTVRKDTNRFHVATWFGVCSYRKLRVTVERHNSVCPLCKHDLVKLRYCGSKVDWWLHFFDNEFFADLEEDSPFGKEVVWVQVDSGSHNYYRGD